MPKRTIYVREQDGALWQEAEKVSGEESLSAFVAEALKRLVAAKQQQQEGFERVELPIWVTDSHTGGIISTRTVAFEGRLIAEDNETDVYLTPRQKLLFYQSETSGSWTGGSYEVFESLREAENEEDRWGKPVYSRDLLSEVAEALGEEYVEELDI